MLATFLIAALFAVDPLPAEVAGGLCVQVGASDLGRTIELARSGRFLVRVLDADAGRVELARQRLEAAGVYGLASADRLRAADRLPLTENLVNLLLLGRLSDLPPAEITRVLCPGGVAVSTAGQVLVRKAWPAQMDVWSHPRHGPDANAVSQDTTVGPPQRVRWIAGPPFTATGLVSAGGRNFYSGVLARDSFNGLRMWKVSLSGSTANDGSEILINPRRREALPVALDDLVLAVRQGTVVALSATKGDLVREYPAAGRPQQFMVLQRTLIAIDSKVSRAVDVDSGHLRWEVQVERPRYLAAGDDRVFFLHGLAERGQTVEASCLNLADGHPRWRRGYPWAASVRGMVYHDGLLALEVSSFSDSKRNNEIHMVNAADGQPLWSHRFAPGMCHAKQARAMFVGQRLWILDDGDHVRGSCTALDPRTGEVLQHAEAGWGHCYPPVATARYLFSGEMHLTDLATGRMNVNRISKGACGEHAGFMPANGLIYVTPKECVCWPMLRENVALAAARPGGHPNEKPLMQLEFPLEHGVDPPRQTAPPSEADWPCYRHDPWRSGSTPAALPDKLRIRWTASLGEWPSRGPIADDWRHNSSVAGPVTAPVVAGDLVYVARPDAHQVVALDARTGAVRWRYRAGARVDTAPTIHGGLCLFGVKSGEVVSLRADDGRMVWRLRVAPLDEQIVAYGQLESPWPVPGSVLVTDGAAYFAAGRQVYADGGILVLAVEPATGRILWRQRLAQLEQRWFYGDNHCEFDAFDLLHREGDRVAMSRWLFDRHDGRPSVDPKRGFAHLTTGGSGVWAPQGSWWYAPLYETIAHKQRPFRRPLVVFRDNGLYGCTEDKQSIYRRDFNIAGGEPFDSEWYRSIYWLQSKRPHELWRSQRLAAGAAWNVRLLDKASPQRQIAAILLAGSRLFAADSEGQLMALSTADGRVVSQTTIPHPVWDAMAAAGGRIYVSTLDGRVVCLE